MQVDLWWGWIDPIFRFWLRTHYPWIRLLYCPGCCTPVGQPMDRGVFALLKGLLRAGYSRWAMYVLPGFEVWT